jgi:UDP-GlcNAc:undecaprenyl-phosphate GlcNAc-1-phosphate transferase
MKLNKQIKKTIAYVGLKLKNKTLSRFLLSVFLSAFSFFYILYRYRYINSEIPFWYTKLWGDYQLAPKFDIFLIPLMMLAISFVGLLFVLLNKYYIQFFEDIIWIFVICGNFILAASSFRIIQIASLPFKPIINPLYLGLLPYAATAFILTFIAMPYFIDFAQKKRLVTNPQIHDHPGMILQSPSARGGGFVYSLVFLISAIIFIGFPEEFLGFYLSVLMVAVLSIIDDYQNTHPSSSYRALENPGLRLFLLLLSVLPVVFSGVAINTVSNPFGGMINLNIFQITIGSGILAVVPVVLTAVWVVWLMNVLSWSNGVDGQYAGIVGIASVLIAILALRFKDLQPFHMQIAILAAISAGASFGAVRFNWHPSQIMWGFGAVSAGLVIASLAILAKSKIAVSVLIILIPFLDAFVTVIRRLVLKKNPFKGDKGHLHHILLSRGWSTSKVAMFYWGATALFGLVGLLTPEENVFNLTFIIAGVVMFLIAVLNLNLVRKKKEENSFTTSVKN